MRQATAPTVVKNSKRNGGFVKVIGTAVVDKFCSIAITPIETQTKQNTTSIFQSLEHRRKSLLAI